MLIRCSAKTGRDLPAECLLPAAGISVDTCFDLIVGKEYVVYGLTLFQAQPWYYICDEAFKYYPVWNPAPLFEVVCGSLSKYWQYAYRNASGRRSGWPILAFSEWVDDPGFYDRLTDGDQSAVNCFLKYKELMDDEALAGR